MTITPPQQAEPEVARRVEEAKEPATPAAGPYGHPFHPILVTLPIGAWIASAVFDIASRASTDGSAAMVEGAYWLIGLGIVGALVAAVFGLFDLLAIPRPSRVREGSRASRGLPLTNRDTGCARFSRRPARPRSSTLSSS